jgi:alpha-1,6-mannosyltransferase
MGHMNRKECLLLLFGLLIEGMCIVYRFAPGNTGQIIIKYMAVFSLFFILTLAAFLLVRKSEFSRIMLYTVFIGAVLFPVTLLSSHPDLSDDVYRYIWDGKVQNMGINPYAYAPSDPRLKPFHSSDLPGRVNFPHLVSLYPPAAQGAFALAYAIFHESLTGMKALFVLFHLGAVLLFYRILGIRKQPPVLLLLYAWNPLPIMETSVNGHLDPLFLFFTLLALFFFYRGRTFFAGFSLGLSILSKVIPLIAVPPFLWEIGKGKDKAKRIMLFLAGIGAPVFLFWLPYRHSIRNLTLSVLHYSSHWYFNNPFFQLLLVFFHDNVRAHRFAGLVLAGALACVLLRFRSLEKKIFYTFLLFVLLNPTVHPWYLIVLVGLLAVQTEPVVFFWSGSIVLSYVVFYRFRVFGIWQDSLPIMAAEYVPLALLLLGRWLWPEKFDWLRI